MNLRRISYSLFQTTAMAALFLAALPVLSATKIATQLTGSAQISQVGGGNSFDPIVTPDGRFVLFASTSDNLVVASNGTPMKESIPAHMNVFLRDRQAGTAVLVSVNVSGVTGGNDDSFPCAISSNGQFAFFQSAASDLVAGDTNAASDVFVRDVVNNTTTMVSVGPDGSPGDGNSREASITPDGRYVAFVSAATNLVAGDQNGIADVFVRDLQLGVTTLASPGAIKSASSGSQTVFSSLTAGSSSESPLISSDGRYVVFYSTASGLVSGVVGGGEIYARDLTQATTTWVSARAHSLKSTSVSANYALSTNGQFIAYQTVGGNPAGIAFRYNIATAATDIIATNTGFVTSLDIESRKIDISQDGRFVAFALTNKVGGGSIQLWDAQSGTTTNVSGGNPTNTAICDMPRLDQSGRYVAFISNDATLTTNSDGAYHIYVCDTATNSIELMDVVPNGTNPISTIMTPFHISADGSVIAFDCEDGSLSANPMKFDAFLRVLNTNVTELVSTPVTTLLSLTPLSFSEFNGFSISSNGQYAAFVSYADGIVPGDTNGVADVYLHDFSTGSNELISISATGPYSGSSSSQEPSISADGRYVAFSSSATNLIANDTNKYEDVFVRDRVNGSTVLVSADVAGTGEGTSFSFSPQISADGQRVLFYSQARNLASNDYSGFVAINIYWRDLQAGITYNLSSGIAAMTPDGSNVLVGATTSTGHPVGVVFWRAATHSSNIVSTINSNVIDVAISPDAHWGAFGIVAVVNSNSVRTNYVADLVGGTNWVLSTSAATSAKGFQFSGDSHFLANVVADTNGVNQIYLYDLLAATNTLVSYSADLLSDGNGASDSPTINADGSLLSYRSAASNLVANDDNGVPDIFLYSRSTGQTTLISASEYGPFSANGRSLKPVLSGDGSTLLFQSWASDLAPGDFNENSDVFAVTLSTNGGGSTGSTNAPPTLTVSLPVDLSNGQFSTNNPLTLNWAAVDGALYEVQFKDELTDLEWQSLSGPVTVVSNQASVTDSTPSADHRFYRLLTH